MTGTTSFKIRPLWRSWFLSFTSATVVSWKTTRIWIWGWGRTRKKWEMSSFLCGPTETLTYFWKSTELPLSPNTSRTISTSGLIWFLAIVSEGSKLSRLSICSTPSPTRGWSTLRAFETPLRRWASNARLMSLDSAPSRSSKFPTLQETRVSPSTPMLLRGSRRRKKR